MTSSAGILGFIGCAALVSAGGLRGGGGGLSASSYTAYTDFGSGGSPLLGSYSTGAYGGIGGGLGGPIAAPYIGGGGISPPFGVGAYSTGAYGAGIGGAQASRYAALAVQSSSSASTVGAYNTYANAIGGGGKHRGPPSLGAFQPPALGLGGGKHGGGKHQKIVAQPYEDVEVQQFVSNEGQLVENEVNAYARKKQYTVTHKPVYHKTTYNHYTATDNINKDVYHHLYEDETRSFEVDGEDFNAGALNVNHGKVDHAPAAYQSIVGGAGQGAYAGYANRGGYSQGAYENQGYASRGGYPSISQPALPRVGTAPSWPAGNFGGLDSPTAAFPAAPAGGDF